MAASSGRPIVSVRPSNSSPTSGPAREAAIRESWRSTVNLSCSPPPSPPQAASSGSSTCGPLRRPAPPARWTRRSAWSRRALSPRGSAPDRGNGSEPSGARSSTDLPSLRRWAICSCTSPRGIHQCTTAPSTNQHRIPCRRECRSDPCSSACATSPGSGATSVLLSSSWHPPDRSVLDRHDLRWSIRYLHIVHQAPGKNAEKKMKLNRLKVALSK
jgi:hypothetical protein